MGTSDRSANFDTYWAPFDSISSICATVRPFRLHGESSMPCIRRFPPICTNRTVSDIMPHIVYFHTNWCILNTCDGGCLYDPNYPEAPQTPDRKSTRLNSSHI